ncbi:MAG: small ribosomal subunit Rsm22 family protein [Acidobacteriota bacterium]
MQLPASLKAAIETEITRVKPEALAQAALAISNAYRTNTDFKKSLFTSDAYRAAYLATRMPATFASIRAVFAEIKNRLPQIELTSLLDLGAGAGTTMWAAGEMFPSLKSITNLERDKGLIEIGKRLAQASEHPAIASAHWLAADLQSNVDLAPHDMVVMSYSLGEMSQTARLIQKAWEAAEKLIVVIEPGTVRGFQHMLAARDAFIKSGAHIIAPCPHQLVCPMAENDWCHFAARVERAAFHRRAKGAILNYEDEKFSYVVAATFDCQPVTARIIRHPFIQKGHIQFELCTNTGLQQLTVSKKNQNAFRRARKSAWGDAWKQIADEVDEREIDERG